VRRRPHGQDVLALEEEDDDEPEEEEEEARREEAKECTAAAKGAGLSCSICLEDFDDDSKKRAFSFERCGALTHAFHEECVASWLDDGGGRCPVCRASLAVMTGTQPKRGTMTDIIVDSALPGFPYGSRTRRITYHFPPGTQGPEHPRPGLPYDGTTRTAFLPTPEGDAAFRLLRVAFKRRLVFRVGQSITTGKDNTVVWAGIHHKTSTTHGAFGYPDPNYLPALLQELQDNGIFLPLAAAKAQVPGGGDARDAGGGT